MEGHRHLVRDELVAAPRLEVGGIGFADEECRRHLAESRVGRTHHDRVTHTGRAAQDLLDLGREHLVATAIDDVRDATLDPDEPVRVDVGEVTGAHVAVGVEPVGEFTPAEVARRHPGRAYGQLPHLPRGQRTVVVADHLDLHAGMRSSDRPELLGMLPGIGRGPADDFADLRLAVPVQHPDLEPVGEAVRLDRRQRRRDAAHVAQRCKVLDFLVVGEHRDRGGRKHGRTDAEPPHELDERTGLEPLHDHDRRAGPEPEQHVVGPGVEREGDRDQVRGRRPLPAATRRSQLAEHPIEQLEVRGMGMEDGFRFAGRPRRPLHEGGVRLTSVASVERVDAVGPDQRGGADRAQGPLDFGLRLAPVDRHEHRAREPHTEHRGDHVGPVRELHRDGLALLDTDVAEELRRRRSSPARLPRCHGTLDRVQQGRVVVEGVRDEQVGQAHAYVVYNIGRAARQGGACPTVLRSPTKASPACGRASASRNRTLSRRTTGARTRTRSARSPRRMATTTRSGATPRTRRPPAGAARSRRLPSSVATP